MQGQTDRRSHLYHSEVVYHVQSIHLSELAQAAQSPVVRRCRRNDSVHSRHWPWRLHSLAALRDLDGFRFRRAQHRQNLYGSGFGAGRKRKRPCSQRQIPSLCCPGHCRGHPLGLHPAPVSALKGGKRDDPSIQKTKVYCVRLGHSHCTPVRLHFYHRLFQLTQWQPFGSHMVDVYGILSAVGALGFVLEHYKKQKQ